ncbi:hypothetical protein BG004_001888 [Podila humilis]|nr:hypothetical protein BG004_001888 [Podila humilis]
MLSLHYSHLVVVCILVLVVGVVIDFEMTWQSKGSIRNILLYNIRDTFFTSLFVAPALVSHIITIWGHYYRSDSLFLGSIARASVADPKERKRISFWERNDPWIGFSTKYWFMVLISIFFNLIWFIQPMVAYIPSGRRGSRVEAILAYTAFSTGYAAMGACGMLLLLVLRRSMFQAIGYTYADLLPLHRWMGVAFVVWSTFHTVFYIAYYIHLDSFWEAFNFDGETRGPQNMIALGAYIRRQGYLFFITMHRILTVITFVGTILHYPYYMIWYYVLPSMCLYLADRFIPKLMMSLAVEPDIVCSFDRDADIATVVVFSRNRNEPLKPYYPGDYINLQFPELSTIYHPFTIASYWAEDPYSMTIFIRTFQENPDSWTGALAKLCPVDGSRMLVKGRVDGVFGDREHNYLSNEVIVIFAAGAAITTFMSLLKAIAAQVTAISATLNNPSTVQVHLICTFRYESELYAYGDFLHRVTHDPRFTAWLRTTLYVSRADKNKPPSACPSGQCGHEGLCERVVPESQTPVPLAYPFPRRPANYGATTTTVAGSCKDAVSHNEQAKPNTERARPYPGCCPESTGTCSSTSTVCGGGHDDKTSGASARVASADSFATVAATDAREDEDIQYNALPTFSEMSSSSIATVHAKKDLTMTTVILLIPAIVYYWSRSIVWEGTRNGEEYWCRTTLFFDQTWTNYCLWSYAMWPPIFHITIASVLGYLGLWLARSTNVLQGKKTGISYGSSASPFWMKSAKKFSPSYSSSSVFSPSSSSSSSSASSLRKGKGGSQGTTTSTTERTDLESDALLASPSMMQSRRFGGLYPEEALSVLVSSGPNKHHSIPFKRGRIQVHYHIQELKMAGIGRGDGLGGASRRKGGVLVFGGGPEAFVEMIDESCKKAEWDVDYISETWQP